MQAANVAAWGLNPCKVPLRLYHTEA